MGKFLSKRSAVHDASLLLIEVPDDIFYHLCDHYLAYEDLLRLAQCNRILNARVTNHLRFKMTNERLKEWELFKRKRKYNDSNLNVILSPTSFINRDRKQFCEIGLFSSTEILLQRIDPSRPSSALILENRKICLFLKVLYVIENCDIWRKSVVYGAVQAVAFSEWDQTLGREIVFVKNTKTLRLYCHLSLLLLSEKKEHQRYSASIYLKLDKHFNWPPDMTSRWSIIDVYDSTGYHPWKNSNNTVHAVEVDKNWWKKIYKGSEDFSLDNIRVVREHEGWVRVDLFHHNPIKIQNKDIILGFETGDLQSFYWKGGIKFDCWQINRHK